MTRQRIFVAIVLLAGLVGGGGWVYVRLQRSQPVNEIILYGNVDIREVQPAFNDSGPITDMLVQEGALVHKGELIARLDDTRYAATLAQTTQQARNQKEILTRLLNGSRPEEIAQAKSSMEALRATYENARASYDRVIVLMTSTIASRQQHDDAKGKLDSSRASYEAAKQAYTLMVKGPRDEDIAAAHATYEAAEAALDLARKQFADTRLYAPADGVVEDRILEPGDMASPSTPVYTIALMSPLWVRAYVAETELGKVALGQPADVTVDSFRDRVYHGWVGYISPTAEFTPKTVETTELRTRLVYQVRVYVCDSANELRLGMPATVTIDAAQPRSAEGRSASPGCRGDNAGEY